MGGDPTVSHGSVNAGFIRSTAARINGYGIWMTHISPGEYFGKGIRLSAYVKTENIEDWDPRRGIGWAGLYMRIDASGSNTLTSDNMRARPIKGTTNWQEYEVILDVPENSTGIFFGILLSGTGEAWVDGLRLESTERTWKLQNSGITEWPFSFKAIDENTVWAGCEKGIYLRTTDGGLNWSSGTVPGAATLTFYSIAAIDRNTAYFMGQNPAGGDGRIYKTSDGGQNWTRQYQNNSSPSVFFNSIAFWDEDHGIAVSDPVNGSFLIITTSNGGLDWEQVQSSRIPTPYPGEYGGITGEGGTSLAVEGSQNVWFGTGYGSAVGSPVRVLRSTDQGQHWTAVNTPLPKSGSFYGIQTIVFKDSLNGFAGGVNDPYDRDNVNSLIKTTDGGKTWALVASFLPIFPSTLVYVPGTNNSVLFVTSLQGSGYSDDGGATWKRLNTQECAPMSFASPSAGWAAMNLHGQIMKSARNLIPTGITDQQPERPEEYGLAQNYPNPFNPLTSIRFSLPTSGFVTLDVYDLNGREIATLVNGSMAAGSHAINFDGSQLASGIYLYRLRAGEYVEAKKMTLVK